MGDIIKKAKCEICAGALAAFLFVITRLAQPSTWASISAALVMLHIDLQPGTWDTIVQVGTGLSALAGIILNERGVKVLSGQQDIDGTKNGLNSTQG